MGNNEVTRGYQEMTLKEAMIEYSYLEKQDEAIRRALKELKSAHYFSMESSKIPKTDSENPKYYPLAVLERALEMNHRRLNELEKGRCTV